MIIFHCSWLNLAPSCPRKAEDDETWDAESDRDYYAVLGALNGWEGETHGVGQLLPSPRRADMFMPWGTMRVTAY